ncbi:uncharacterized protein LOC135334230 [Halichondria panicea]|uniref:uncharacterized protein LOC135334230 n=1 Tax=Halichondria panicea TaxID=6063 RepID=UPI00312BAD34
MSEQKEYGELTIDKLMTNTGLTDEQVNQEIAEKDLSKIADLFDNIDDLCEQFGLSPPEKTDVKRLQHRSTKNSTKKALEYWRNRFPYMATFKNLLIILLDIKKGGVAKDVAEYISNRGATNEQPRPKEEKKDFCYYQYFISAGVVILATGLALWVLAPCIEDHSIRLPTPIFKMTKFEQYKENDTVWRSPPVYTHHRGYKIILGVYPNGYPGKGRHVGAGIFFIRGEFDDSLKWPFRGTIHFRLIDQLHGEDHVEHTVIYNNTVESMYSDRVVEEEEATLGLGNPILIKHSELKPNYLLYNTLLFQIHKYSIE